MTIIVSVNTAPGLNTGTGQPPTNVLITEVSTEIIAANVNRTSLYLLNIGRDDVWVSCDADAEFEKGMLLGNGGGSMLIDSTSFTTGPVNGICQGGRSSTLSLQELST